jgi:glycogen synthase
MNVCLVSREVAPFGGGGIGVYVLTLARLLSAVADVRIVTTDVHRAAFERLCAAGARPGGDGVQWTFVPEPTPRDAATFAGFGHAWSALALRALEAAYPGRGPDLVEFGDFGGEGFATIQAKRSGAPFLSATRIAVRLHTSGEMCAVLDGFLPGDRENRVMCAIERYCLQHADTLLWAGGDILGMYERYYAGVRLAPAERVRHPLDLDALPAGDPGAGPEPGRPLALLYAGRLERRKGVQRLVRALMDDPSERWTLTLLGADTDTGPLGASMRAHLELATLGDERVRFCEGVGRDELAALVRAHDVVVLPSRWECWPYVALEALALDRPLLATPTGGHLELVDHDTTGWLTETTQEPAIAAALGELLDDPGRVARVVASGACRRHAAALTDGGEIRAAYERLAATPAPWAGASARRRAEPLVSVVIPYHRLAGYVGETVASIAAQTHRNTEIVVVDDGSLEPADAVLDELEAAFGARILHQPNRGVSAARNAGIRVSRGRYVFPLDADNVAEPTFVERCVAVLEAEPGLGYVTSWSRYVDERGDPVDAGYEDGYAPLGNFSDLVEHTNVAGDAAAVLPRRVFGTHGWYSEDVPIEDWMFYRRLRRAGVVGHVIPERLLRYRVRPASIYRESEAYLGRAAAEIETELRVEQLAWVPADR